MNDHISDVLCATRMTEFFLGFSVFDRGKLKQARLANSQLELELDQAFRVVDVARDVSIPSPPRSCSSHELGWGRERATHASWYSAWLSSG